MSFNQHHTNCLLLTVIAKRKDTVQESRKIFKFLLSEGPYWVGLRSKQHRLSAATPKVTTNVTENLEQILTRSVNKNFYGEHIQIKLYSN